MSMTDPQQPTTDSAIGEFNPSSRRRRKRRNYFLLIAAVIVVAIGVSLWLKDDAQVAEDQPLIETVTKGNIENTVAAAGSLKPLKVVEVGAQVSGLLQKLHVEVGDVVKEGQLLAEIDARVQASRVEASRANLAALEAQIDARKAGLELARANAARQERLRTDKATSQLDYDNAVNALASAESSLTQLQKQIEQSRASLDSDETTLEYSKIFAPIGGTVVSIDMIEGRTLNAVQMAPTILRIADLSTMTVQTEISEADIASVKKGMEVYFTTLGGGDRRWYSKVRQILPTPLVENNVVLYTGLFDIENADGSLMPEMTAQVFFVTEAARDVLTVPIGALTFAEDAQPGNAAPQMAAGSGPGGMPPAGAVPGGRPGGAGGAMVFNGEMTEEMRQRIRERIAQGGGFPGGGPPPGGFPGGFGRPGNGMSQGAAGAPPARRDATVKVVRADNSTEERKVVIGVSSRIKAEVISGLAEGEKVVAGIVQAESTETEQQAGSNNNFRGPPGGFMPPFMR